MKNLSTLSIEQKRKVVFERINSIFEIEHDELALLLDPQSLSSIFSEIPPILVGYSIETAAAFSVDKPEIEQMYLHTYRLGGKVFFGHIKHLDKYYIQFQFSYSSEPYIFHKDGKPFIIDGANGLRYFNVGQIFNSNSNSIHLMPSLTLNIVKDGDTVLNQSLMTMVNPYQFNKEYVIINRNFLEFSKLEINIVDNSKSHDYFLCLTYK